MAKRIKVSISDLTGNSAWQRLMDLRVREEVQACASTMVFELKGVEKIAQTDEYMNLQQSDDWTEPANDHKRSNGRSSPANVFFGSGDQDEAREYCEEHRLDPYINEVYEHWIVSGWLASKLQERGEITGELLGFTIWGRCCTGQSISMDHVISEIFFEVLHDIPEVKKIVKEIRATKRASAQAKPGAELHAAS